jgi:glucose-6-phosphate 1-dehydrogenase
MIRQLLVLGASGDLTGRYLLPALDRLYETGSLPEPLMVVGVARNDWDTAGFRRHIAARLERHAPTVDPATREAVAALASYHRADVGEATALAGAIDQTKGPVVAYLALPPAAFAPAILALASVGLPDGSGVVVKKPFGRSLAEAHALNRLLDRRFGRMRSSSPTTSWACRPSRTCSGCASPTGSLSRCGTPGTSSGSRSSGRRPSPWRGAPATTTTPARCAT